MKSCKEMIKNILNGELPSAVFKNLMKGNSALTRYDISNIISNEFVRLDSKASTSLWYWKSPGRDRGLSDEALDAIFLELLKKAGYLP